MALLFVYGTLQHPLLLARLLGRTPPSVAAELPGHRAAPLDGRVYPGLVVDPASVAPGLLLDVTDDEVAVLDVFEGSEYLRTEVVATRDGREVPCQAWLLTGASARLAQAGAWSFERFVTDGLRDFLGDSTSGRPHPGAGP